MIGGEPYTLGLFDTAGMTLFKPFYLNKINIKYNKMFSKFALSGIADCNAGLLGLY